MLNILLTTKNEAKVEAVRNFFLSLNKDAVIECLTVESGVSDTPFSHEDGVRGCKNRIENAKKLSNNYDIIIGMEGVVINYDFGIGLCGRAVIETKDGKVGIGGSGQCLLPKKIADSIQPNIQLRDLIIQEYPEIKPIIRSQGTNGFLTQGLYTRVDEFDDALRCAWGNLSYA